MSFDVDRSGETTGMAFLLGAVIAALLLVAGFGVSAWAVGSLPQ